MYCAGSWINILKNYLNSFSSGIQQRQDVISDMKYLWNRKKPQQIKINLKELQKDSDMMWTIHVVG